MGRGADGRVVVQGRGGWTQPHVEVVTQGLNEAADTSEELFPIFWDLAGLDHYDSATRKGVTKWLVANSRRLGRHHYLVATNSLVAMGASTTGLALSVVGVRVHVTRDPAEFVRWFEGEETPA